MMNPGFASEASGEAALGFMASLFLCPLAFSDLRYGVRGEFAVIT